MKSAQLATLCYLKREQQTLMLNRIGRADDIHLGKWNGLGGKFEPGESPEQCVTREVEEESGLCIVEPKCCGFLTFPRFKDGQDWYVFVYVADNFSGTQINSPEGVLEWIPDDELLGLNLWEGDKYFLPWINQGRFFSAVFVYENKKLVEHSVVFHNNR